MSRAGHPPRRPRRGDDGGWVLVSAVILLALMTTASLALLSVVDGQTGQSRVQRVRETAFNLAEAGLNAQIFSLSRDWPGKGMAGNPYPTCSPGSSSTRCPPATEVPGLLASADTTGATWQTIVRDNGSSGTANFYSDSLVTAQPAYDANGDGQLWVRSTATAQGKTRTIVGLVRAETQEEDIPHGALITGRLDLSNMGNKIIIDASAGGGSPTAVVRCVPASNESDPCLGHPIGQGAIKDYASLLQWLGKELTPNVTQTGYTGGPAMTPEARARLKATAIADGTYYASGCPSSLTGHVVYIESGNCVYNGNSVFNSQADPGMVLMATGTLYIGGTTIFNGVVYHANTNNATGDVLQIQGNATIVGGVLIDGAGTTIAGSSKLNIQFAPAAFRAVASYGSAGVIQNTWREINGPTS